MPDGGRYIPKPANQKTDFSEPFNVSFSNSALYFQLDATEVFQVHILQLDHPQLKCTLSAALLL